MRTVMENMRVLDGAAGDLIIEPQTLNNSAASTSWIDMRHFFNAVAIISAGAIEALGALTCKLEEAKDATDSGGLKQDIAGATVAFAAAEAGLSKVIELKTEDMDVQNDFCFVRLTITETVTKDVVVAGTLLLGPSRFRANPMID